MQTSSLPEMFRAWNSGGSLPGLARQHLDQAGREASENRAQAAFDEAARLDDSAQDLAPGACQFFIRGKDSVCAGYWDQGNSQEGDVARTEAKNGKTTFARIITDPGHLVSLSVEKSRLAVKIRAEHIDRKSPEDAFFQETTLAVDPHPIKPPHKPHPHHPMKPRACKPLEQSDGLEDAPPRTVTEEEQRWVLDQTKWLVAEAHKLDNSNTDVNPEEGIGFCPHPGASYACWMLKDGKTATDLRSVSTQFRESYFHHIKRTPETLQYLEVYNDGDGHGLARLYLIDRLDPRKSTFQEGSVSHADLSLA